MTMPMAMASTHAASRYAARVFTKAGASKGRPAVTPGPKISTARRGVVARAAKRDDQPENWQLKYLYDGGRTGCNSLVKLLKSKKGHEKIWYVMEDHRRSPASRLA